MKNKVSRQRSLSVLVYGPCLFVPLECTNICHDYDYDYAT
jgi:hypothetical protein